MLKYAIFVLIFVLAFSFCGYALEMEREGKQRGRP